ncbi:Nramp family divalent metal transporter [Veillonella caviae]|uniref:Nramp family divalent metal transporter n=1 Tax=Veillonella caviae TaxID=248316 RepID=UPI0023F7A0C6|nr:Nramp family divalent metal transporter [Veillonella caviae]
MSEKKEYTFKEKLKALGPGFLIVGSFIGPGTVTSSTRAGAEYGYTLLWCIIFSVIAVIVTQGMAARLGVVTQKGLAENLMLDFANQPIIRNILVILVGIAITIGGFAYMGGDLTGTALGVSALTGIPVHTIAAIWGVCIIFLISGKGEAVKQLEKLLGACVLIMAIVFLITMIIVKPDLSIVFAGAIPIIPEGSLMTCLSLIGTTVVPYNMFLHAASAQRTWKTTAELPLVSFGTKIPMLIGGVVTAAILITSATVMLGMPVRNALDMAVQLEPTLGSFATPFMAVGLIAAGISSAVCTPLGVSYVLAGLFGWKTERSDKRFFYTNIAVLVTGITIAAIGFNPIALIMAAQAVNGIVLPVVVGVVVYLTSKYSIMGEFKNSTIQTILGVLIFLISLYLGLSSVISLF